MRKPRALKPGDRIAVVAPASAFVRAEFDAGVAELQALGFEPVYEESVFERRAYAAGSATTRAAAFARAWRDPDYRGADCRARRLWQRPPAASARGIIASRAAQGVHWLQRQHLIVVMADIDGRHRLFPRADAGGPARSWGGGVRSDRRFSDVCAGRNRRTKSAIRRSRCFIRAKRPGCSSEER